MHLIGCDFAQILDWAARADFLQGRWISAVVGTAVYEGVAQGIDPEGGLLIRTASGTVVRVTSGEVTRFSTL